MKKVCCFLLLEAVFYILQISPALAVPSSGDEIWGKLATKAGAIGAGLQRSGYIIAGLGLIFFSFMAIFNKISWKNLAYIMLSCFVLTLMVALINYFSQTGDPQTENLTFQGPDADTSFSGGVQEAQGTQPGIKK